MRHLILFLAMLYACPAVSGETLGGKLFPAVSLASEHRFNSMSLTDGNPAIQFSLHVWRPDDYYAGIWMTNVDFRDPNDTSVELDMYVGRDFDAGSIEISLEAMYSAFDDNEPGATYDFLQFKSKVSGDLGWLAPHASMEFSPAGSFGAGPTWQLKAGASGELTKWLSVDVLVGRGLYENSSERNYFETGFTASLDTVHFDVRYVDMDTDLPLCRFVDWCEAAIVGKITFATY